MLFLINVVIAVATLWNTVEDHSEALTKFRSAVGAEKLKARRKLFLLWLIPILSMAAIPLTWRAETKSEKEIAVLNDRASSNELARIELKKQIAQLDLETANSEFRLLELQKRISWRRLSPDFSKELSTGPAGFAEIEYPSTDDEAGFLADQIWQALLSAGWNVNHPLGRLASEQPFSLQFGGTMTSNWKGVTLLFSGPEILGERDSGKTAADAIRRAFAKADLPALTTVPHEGLRPKSGVIRIVVNSRL